MALKGIGPSALARQFKVTPSSIGDWRKRGCIHKRHIGPLVAFFSDVVPPTHWGLQPEHHRHMGLPSLSEPRPLTPGLYTVEGDRSRIEARSVALERDLSDIDPLRFSPMALELAKQLDAIRDDKRQLESFVKCIAIVAQAQT
ncbi:MAG: hypothetical protein QM742_05910 [Aquabacterium sp.]